VHVRDAQPPQLAASQSAIGCECPAGEAIYAVMIGPGEEILTGDGRRLRVLDVVPIDDEEGSPFVGLLRVELT